MVSEVRNTGESRGSLCGHSRHDKELRVHLVDLGGLGQTARQPGRRGGRCEHMAD